LDFTLARPVEFGPIRRELETAFEAAHQVSGVVLRYARDDRHPHANSYTFYLGYEGPLPGGPAGKEVKVDITIREKIVFPVERRPVLRGYEEYADLPEGTALRVYSLDEIAVEKTVAVMDRARNEPRDLYDIWYLAEEAHVDLDHLKGAVEEKLGFRGKKLDDVRGEFAAKEARFKKLWQIRLAAQLASLPEFDEVYRAVRRSFRQAGLS